MHDGDHDHHHEQVTSRLKAKLIIKCAHCDHPCCDLVTLMAVMQYY